MPEKKNPFMVRYVVMISKEAEKEWDDTDFVLITTSKSWLTEDFVFALIQPTIDDCNYTAEDVLEITDALVVHEEYTHGILTDVERLDEIGEIYSWSGSGGCLLYDMLTETERLGLIMNHFYIKHKERVEISDLYITLGKDLPKIPIEGNITKLFGIDVNDIIYKDEHEALWGAFLIEESGYFLIVLDAALDYADELEEEYETNGAAWGRFFDDDDDDYYDGHYIDKYCKNKGLL